MFMWPCVLSITGRADMKKYITLLTCLITCLTLHAQHVPVFRPLRYEDDFSYLKKDSSRNVYEKIKFMPIDRNSEIYISFGGEFRYQFFSVRNENWGDARKPNDLYLLSRYQGHADLHFTNAIRVFIQLQSSLSNSKIEPSAVDYNPIDLHQAFVDFKLFEQSGHKLLFRAGRQEMRYGSQRLISLRERPNSRQSFDGLKIISKQRDFSIDAFYTQPVANRPGNFDDGLNRNAKLWGGYAVIEKIPVVGNADLYYLGLWKGKSVYESLSGKELRHTLGFRIWEEKGNLKYDFESAYQFGQIGKEEISGWTVSANTSYTFSGIRFRPKIGLKTEAISGDKRRDDGRLETFNPLYPRGAYFGLAALVGPVNLYDIHPSLQLDLTKKLNLNIDYDLFWRLSDADGVYAPNLQIIYQGNGRSEHYIGSQLAANLDYQFNPFIFISIEGTWARAGDFLKRVGPGRNILFSGITAQLKF